MARINLSEQYEEAVSTCHDLCHEADSLAKNLDQAELVRDLASSDVKSLQEDLASAISSSDKRFFEEELRKNLSKLTEARSQARQAKQKHLQAEERMEEQTFIVEVLRLQLEDRPSAPWERRQAEHRLQRAGSPPRLQANIAQIRRIYEWRKATESCFADYRQITCFPSLPRIVECSNRSCLIGSHGSCTCNIKACFRLIPTFDPSKERLRWHPDRFFACRDSFRAQAHVIFQVLDALHLAESNAMKCE